MTVARLPNLSSHPKLFKCSCSVVQRVYKSSKTSGSPNVRSSAESGSDDAEEAEDEEADDSRGGVVSRIRKLSLAARYGTTHHSDEGLPVELQEAIWQKLDGVDRKAIREESLDIWTRLDADWDRPEAYKKVDKYGPTYVALSKKVRHKTEARHARSAKQDSIARFDDLGSLAYATGHLPRNVAATKAVFREVERRLAHTVADRPAFVPSFITDWGSGVGGVAWAAQETWPDLRDYVGLDRSVSMIDMAKSLFTASPTSFCPTFEQGTLFDTSNEAPVLAISSLRDPSSTMAVAAFTLGELSSDEERKKLVRTMWTSGAEVIVLIDYGVPSGFERIATAREQLLRLGRESLTGKEEDNMAMLDTQTGEIAQPATPMKSGSHVVAPCPHDSTCPLQNKRDYCHFFQPYLQHKAERTVSIYNGNQGYARYSYVVIRRGARPNSPLFGSIAKGHLLPSASHKEVQAQLKTTKTTLAPYEGTELENQGQAEANMRIEALSWPRVLYRPLKRQKAVFVDACTANGVIQRWAISKNTDDNKVARRDAKLTKWGDLFPHDLKGQKLENRDRGITRLTPIEKRRAMRVPDDDTLLEEEDEPGVTLDLSAVLQDQPKKPPSGTRL